MVHISKCVQFFQIWPIFQSVTYFLQCGLFFKMWAIFLQCDLYFFSLFFCGVIRANISLLIKFQLHAPVETKYWWIECRRWQFTNTWKWKSHGRSGGFTFSLINRPINCFIDIFQIWKMSKTRNGNRLLKNFMNYKK